jgi:hypothetical protein
MVVTLAKLIAETFTNHRNQFPSLVSIVPNVTQLALYYRNAFPLEAGIFGKCGKSSSCSFWLAILWLGPLRQMEAVFADRPCSDGGGASRTVIPTIPSTCAITFHGWVAIPNSPISGRNALPLCRFQR